MPGSIGSGLNSIASDVVAGFFTDTPDMPAAPHVNLGDSQKTAITSNLANMTDAEKLAAGTNDFNFEQLHKQLGEAIPGYNDIIKGQSDILQSELKGELPQDVQDQIQRNSAVKSLYGGFAGGGMERNLTARDLGLTSLQLTNTALDSASRWMSNVKSMATTPLFNLSSMFISPEQQFNADWMNATSSFQRNWANNQMETAASNASTRAIGNILGDTVNTAQSAYGMFGGGGSPAAGGSAGLNTNMVTGGSMTF